MKRPQGEHDDEHYGTATSLHLLADKKAVVTG